MNRLMRWLTAAAFLVVAALPLTVGGAAPVRPLACVDGETGVTNGCAPFCLPGLEMDLQTGLCLPPKQAPPPPPQ